MLLTGILVSLIVSIFMILISWGLGQKKIQSISLCGTLVTFFLSVFIWIFFDRTNFHYQFVIKFLPWCFDLPDVLGHFRLTLFILGVDGISIFFILLTTFIMPLCLLTSWQYELVQIKEYCLYFLLLEFFLILSFTALDLLIFFVFFESILIPMFFIIGIWGSRERRVRAALLFFLYTLVGSIFLFFTLLIVFYDVGSTNFYILTIVSIESEKQIILWVLVYVAFMIKIPTVPAHIWLPEAHVEAPTAGSVILAGLLLKLGGYGFLRILLPMFPAATVFYVPMADTFSIISIIYASLTTLRQIDLKRIIAYSSVAHMNLVVLGIFSGNIEGVSGSIFLMIAHGIVSSALFFLIGTLYDKYGTRFTCYYGGLVQTMPVFSTYLLLFCLANIGLPGTCNFVGELVVFAGLVEKSFVILMIAVTGIIFSVLYTMLLFNRIAFGNFNKMYVKTYTDLTRREVATIIPLAVLTIVFGIFPDLIFDTIYASVSIFIEQSKSP